MLIKDPYRDVCESILPYLKKDDNEHELPDDTVLYRVADQFDVYFVVMLHEPGWPDPHAETTEVVLTERQRKRWRVKLDTIVDRAGWNGGDIAIWDWPRVMEGLDLYEYPDHNDHWVSHIIHPGCLLEHTDAPDPKTVMIPTTRTVFIAGLSDLRAQKQMFLRSVEIAAGKTPLTKRPLIIDDKWKRWNVLPDEENPFVDEYRQQFGPL
ncbi:hypothetical protein [Thalassoroseus pseudoceratinae]|uniref:hypothetical protein n=1 Tax=Thalassoroseus pseudoceratinae TaxID=2713176 RepID=UPI0014244DF3|nr:hypothetical protein [Thalassoroseus pseudoceratinae]